MKSLETSLRSIEDFTSQFQHNPGGYVRMYFKNNKKNFKPSEKPILIDIKEEWKHYLEKNDVTTPEKKRIIRLGLAHRGLENHKDFRELIARQDPQKKLLQWLYAYVLKNQILNPQFKFADFFWLDLLIAWTKALQDQKLTLLLAFKKRLENEASREFYEKEIETIFDGVKINNTFDCELEVEQLLLNRYHVAFYSSDKIYQSCLEYFFEIKFKEYQINRNKESLSELLRIFCSSLIQEKDCKRFTLIFDFVYSRIFDWERKFIKAFVKNQFGDPRIEKNNWSYFKEHYNDYYKKILYWFNELDFDLFFDFVFAGKPDPHGRKQCWKRYLYLADDVRIFLPTKEDIANLKKFATERNTDNVMEPILNDAWLRAFVIKIDKIIIYEAIKTGNAAYVYDLGSDELLNPKKFECLQVKDFADKIFGKNKVPNSVHTANSLAFVDLAPDGKYQFHFNSSRNWRFTHDSDCFWHKSVELMMRQVHGISPSKKK